MNQTIKPSSDPKQNPKDNPETNASSHSVRQSALDVILISLSETSAGFAVGEVSGFSPEMVRRAAEALVRQGRMVRAKVSPRRVRYFANDALAREYASAASAAAVGSRIKGGVAGGLRTKAPWRPEDPAIITPQTRIVVAPPLPDNVYRTNTYLKF